MTTESQLVALTQALGADYKAMHLSIGDITALKTVAKNNLVAALNELYDRPSAPAAGLIDDTNYGPVGSFPSGYSYGKAFSAWKVMTLLNGLYSGIENAHDRIDTLTDSLNSYAQINDSVTAGTTTWSSTKILEALGVESQSATDKVAALRSELTAGASSALDTFKELADAMGNDPTFAATLATQLSKRVRFDVAQVLTTAEKLQACTNLGIGNPEVDLLAAYNAAKV